MQKIVFQGQHKAFVTVRNNLKKEKKRQAWYADKNAKVIDFEIGDPVYYRNNRRTNKFDLKWKPFYRIIDKKGPVDLLNQKPIGWFS